MYKHTIFDLFGPMAKVRQHRATLKKGKQTNDRYLVVFNHTATAR